MFLLNKMIKYKITVIINTNNHKPRMNKPIQKNMKN